MNETAGGTSHKDDKGLFRKFEVRRTDGTDQPGGVHYGDTYFVLNLTHDFAAPIALKSYVDAVRHDRPQLARELAAVLANGPPYRWPHDGQ
jgi:hypothetical protein